MKFGNLISHFALCVSLIFIGGVFVGSIESDPAKSDGRLQPGDQILEVY